MDLIARMSVVVFLLMMVASSSAIRGSKLYMVEKNGELMGGEILGHEAQEDGMEANYRDDAYHGSYVSNHHSIPRQDFSSYSNTPPQGGGGAGGGSGENGEG